MRQVGPAQLRKPQLATAHLCFAEIGLRKIRSECEHLPQDRFVKVGPDKLALCRFALGRTAWDKSAPDRFPFSKFASVSTVSDRSAPDRSGVLSGELARQSFQPVTPPRKM